MFKPWWFPEYLPSEQKIFDKIVDVFWKISSQFWYNHLHTCAVEKNEVLLKWWEETSKQIFWLYWLAQWSEDLKSYSLHFDLTVPLARYVIDNESSLVFPFKRYQAQPVWRWERSQKWRYKEFWQADIDIIWPNWTNNHNFLYDAEVMFVASRILLEIKKTFWLNFSFEMKYNNRKLISGLLSIVDSDEDKKTIIKLLDDYYKIWAEKFNSEILSLWLNENVQKKIMEYCDLTIDNINSDFIDNDEFKRWVEELRIVSNYIKMFNFVWDFSFKFDPFIVRWLDYYTGTVFETFVKEEFSLWSIYSWWRYEWLTSKLREKWNQYDWVWISMWISRIFSLILENVNLKKISDTETYLFLYFDETIQDIIIVMNRFISEWKKCELYPFADKLKKQFKYAEKKNIKNVVFLWEWEKYDNVFKIKNIETWDEEFISL